MITSSRARARAGALCLFVLQTVAFALATGEARAASWTCTIVDGQDSTNSGHTTLPVQGASGAINFLGDAVPLYTRHDSSGHVVLRYGVGASCEAGADPFSVFDVDGNTGERAPGGSTTPSWYGYIDGSNNLHAVEANVASAPIIFTAPAGTSLVDPPVFSTDGTNTYVFYTLYDSPGAGQASLRYQVFTAGSGWSMSEEIQNTSYSVPSPGVAAVNFTNTVWVFNADRDDGSVEAWYWNGSTFRPGGMDKSEYIDGFLAGGLTGGTGQTLDQVGFYLSAVVYGPTVYVFYADLSTSRVRTASYYSGLGGGTWNAEDVDDSLIAFPAAAVVSPVPEIFYVDETSHTVRQSYLQTSGTWGHVVVDGAGATTANHTAHALAGPIAATVRSNCTTAGPYVFYQDSERHNLREAFWR